MIRRVFICIGIIMILVLSLSACSDGKGAGPVPQQQKLTEIIPSLDNPTRVAVKVTGFALDHFSDTGISLSIYAPADGAQSKKIVDNLELLSSAEFTEVDEYDRERYPFTTSAILIENSSGSFVFSVIASEDADSKVYLAVIPDQTPADISESGEMLPIRYYECQACSFRIRALNEALTDVLLDTADLQNVAVLRFVDNDEIVHTLNKSVTAVWRYVFDASIRINGQLEEPEGQGYDVEVTIGDTTYCLDKSSGRFSMVNGEETVFGKLSEDTLTWFMERFGPYLS